MWELAAINEPCQIRPGVGRTPRQIFSIDLKSTLRDSRARECVEELLCLAFFWGEDRLRAAQVRTEGTHALPQSGQALRFVHRAPGGLAAT